MEHRQFGTTDLHTSIIGFGAWGIGGPAMAGPIPIGWGEADDSNSVVALELAIDRGMNFIDTADFYGLGHSEELIGRVVGNRHDLLVATKVGHRLESGGGIATDYSRDHIMRSCEGSLRRLRRDRIDYYQLHSARLVHLEQGDCVDAMERLREQGKIRYWGLSLNTFSPAPEAEYMMRRRIGHGFQLVLNIINQRAVPLLAPMQAAGYGIIVRMPLQFGVLTGKFTGNARFPANDHRSFRLTPEILRLALSILGDLHPLTDRYATTLTSLALSFCAAFPEVSTIITGIKTPTQAQENSQPFVEIEERDMLFLTTTIRHRMLEVVALMERQG